MKSLRFLDRRAGYSIGALGILLGMAAPALVPAMSSAAVMTSRSITLSNSASSATSVSYEVKATLPGGLPADGGAFIEFCDAASGPLIDTTCTKPTGLTVAGVGVGSGGGTAADFDSTNHNVIKWTDGNMPGATSPDPFVDATNLGTYVDSGAVALSTTATVGVTAYVLESMTFCVTGTSAPAHDCTGTLNSPSMTIGESVGNGQLALDTTHVSTGTDYMLLSTNAVGGAVVNLKSDASSCGGLKLVGGTGCIPAQTSGTVSAGTAGFGLKLGTLGDASGASATSGTIQSASGSSYDGTNYLADYAAGNATGITSTYGSKFVDTNGAAVNNKTLDFTMGATIGNNTPAGKYSANLNLIATGTF
jgi:hypothetical protein